jgi:hypothetical protein
METYKDGTSSFLVGIRAEHDFIEIDDIPIEFEELWQFYNKDALNKTLLTCYCL